MSQRCNYNVKMEGRSDYCYVILPVCDWLNTSCGPKWRSDIFELTTFMSTLSFGPNACSGSKHKTKESVLIIVLLQGIYRNVPGPKAAFAPLSSHGQRSVTSCVISTKAEFSSFWAHKFRESWHSGPLILFRTYLLLYPKPCSRGPWFI